MGMRSAKDVLVARFVGTTWMIIGLYGSIFTGFVGFAYVGYEYAFIFSAQGIEVIMKDVRQGLVDDKIILVVFANVLFHPLVAGHILAAIMSAIMSTVDSQLLVSSSAVAEDFYKGFFRKKASDKELVWVGRIATVAIALIAGIIATNPDSKVL